MGLLLPMRRAEATDRRRMHPEYPPRVHHVDDSGLLLGTKLGPAPPNPAWVCSRIVAHSNSAKLPTICISIRPEGVVVSVASVRLRTPAPAYATRSIRWRRSFSERDKRSSFQTTTISLGRNGSRRRCSRGPFLQD